MLFRLGKLSKLKSGESFDWEIKKAQVPEVIQDKFLS